MSSAPLRLNPSYLQAQSSHIMAMHSSDRIDPEQIDSASGMGGAFLPGKSSVGTRVSTRVAERPTLAVDSSP